jgi:hypothetical protein
MGMKEEILKMLGADADGWEVDYDDCLICPCGDRIEDDGKCPNGCVSPLITAGMI